jgi:hypothetical protein
LASDTLGISDANYQLAGDEGRSIPFDIARRYREKLLVKKSSFVPSGHAGPDALPLHEAPCYDAG